jgi:Flp pilus assembly protein TadG
VFAKPWRSCDKGTAAIEFALVAPLFLLITIGGFNLAWGLHCIQNVQYAMAKAARVLELHPTTTESELETIVKNNMYIDTKDTVSLTLEIDPPDGGTKLAHATVEYDLTFWIPFVGKYEMTRTTTVTVPIAVI